MINDSLRIDRSEGYHKARNLPSFYVRVITGSGWMQSSVHTHEEAETLQVMLYENKVFGNIIFSPPCGE